VEHARHEKSLAQCHLENFKIIERSDPPPPQGEIADGRALKI